MPESPIYTKKAVTFTPPSLKDKGAVFTIKVPTMRDKADIRIELQNMGLTYPSDEQQQSITRECIREVYPADQANDVEAQYDQMLGYATEGLEMPQDMKAASRALDGVLAQHSPTYRALNVQIQRFKEYHPFVLIKRLVRGWEGLDFEPSFDLDKTIEEDCVDRLWDTIADTAWTELYLEIATMLEPELATRKKSGPSRASKTNGRRGKTTRPKEASRAPSSSTEETTTNSQSA